MFRWTDDADGQLRKMHAEGLSFGQIAERIGQVSRNAAIGRAHRLGLDPRAKVYTPPSPEKRKARANALARQARAKRNGTAARIQPTRASRLSLIPVDGTPLPLPHETDIPRVSILDLENHHCRWVCGETTSVDAKVYCGCKKVPGLSFCENHARRAYEPARSKAKPSTYQKPIRAPWVLSTMTFEDA